LARELGLSHRLVRPGVVCDNRQLALEALPPVLKRAHETTVSSTLDERVREPLPGDG
jgi:hypothetical protein